MDGTIAVDSEPGRGSEFAFEIPASEPERAGQMRGPVLAGRRAVIVSKNSMEAEAIASTIRAHGGEADIAATAAQAARPGRRRATRCWSMRRWSRPTGAC